MPQTIKQRRIISRAAANDPRVERATYHRDPNWIELPPRSPERLVGRVLAIIAVAMALGSIVDRYAPDTVQAVIAEVRR